MRLLTGVPEVDELAARIATPAPQTVGSAADIPADATVARISARTRDLEALADRPELRRLVAARIRDDGLRHLARMSALEALELTNPQCRSLESLAGCAGLEVLTASASSQLASIQGVETLSRLRLLSTWHTPSISAIDAIASLGRLQVVHLAGAMYRPMRLASLEPLARLRSLRMLTLSGVRVRDRSLRPLGRLTELRRLELPLHFAAAEFEWLERALPAAEGQWKTAWRGAASRR